MQKRMKVMLLLSGLLFGCIFLYKEIVNMMIAKAMKNLSTVINVSASKIGYSQWQSELSATGSLRAIQGVNVTTELAGMVQSIYFKPGSITSKGTLLVQLNADSDIALLHSLEANVELANTTYLRDSAQYKIHAVSKQVVDTDAANLKSLKAQVAQQAAIVAKKSIRAPFNGHLGINMVNPGQYLNPGDVVVNLQTLNPIYADFYLPQQALSKIKMGQAVIVQSDTYPKQLFKGTITTINPAVDVNTRNVQVEATLANPEHKLVPGMFAKIKIITGKPERFLTAPQTAVAFNPYGSIVFIVHEQKNKNDGKSVLTVSQRFIKTGETRGEQVKILKGLKEGDLIVTSGQLKLKNNSQITIDNSIIPSNNPAPKLNNNH